MWNYSKEVMDHFMNPRNVGEIENPDGVGEVGNAACGDDLVSDGNSGRFVDVQESDRVALLCHFFCECGAQNTTCTGYNTYVIHG